MSKPAPKTPEQVEWDVRFTPPDYPKAPSGAVTAALVHAGLPSVLMGALYTDGEAVLGYLPARGVHANAMQGWWRDTLRQAYAMRTPAQDVWAYWTGGTGNPAMDIGIPERYDTLDDLLKVLTRV